MKIIIADSFPQSHFEALLADGHEITFDPALDGDALAQTIKDNEALVVRSTKVSAETLAAGEMLKLVIRAGAGTNTIDTAYAADNGIQVCNVPGANAIAVAELVMGLIIAIDRNIVDNVSDLRNNIWNKKIYSRAQGLCGQKIGILGLGAIGLAVAERANAFGMEVFAENKPGRSANAIQRAHHAGIHQLDSMDQVLATCDIVSLHMPATEQTRNLVNADFLGKMKHGAILINSSRGELVDEKSLIEAINSKGIRVGLDVYNNEPSAGDSRFNCELAAHPAVCGTHHIGSSTNQAQTAVADGVLDIIQSYQGGEVIYCVN